MARIDFPYGRKKIELEIDDGHLVGVLNSPLHHMKCDAAQERLVLEAMDKPIGSRKLKELAIGKKKVVIIASDHTRPVPSRAIIPPMLREIREGSPDAEITILIATGCHRETTLEELAAKFGPEIVAREKIVVHDCDDREMLVNIGTLPSGGPCVINRLAMEADLLVAEGFIEPHFFAGFSGGRKSVLPGIAARETVLANHCSEFIANPHARTGVLEGNPIHRDMLWAAKQAGLAYIVNVVINGDKEAVHAVAGEPEAAHAAGCAYLEKVCGVRAKAADIAIATNGGYPLDQNIYQAVKGMTAAEAAVRRGGVIIMLASSADGHGGEAFYRQLADEPEIEKTLEMFMSRDRSRTEPDQWQTQIFIRVLQRAKVIYVSEAPDDMVRALHMIPASSAQEALEMAVSMIGKPDYTVNAIPDGVAVMVLPEPE